MGGGASFHRLDELGGITPEKAVVMFKVTDLRTFRVEVSYD